MRPDADAERVRALLRDLGRHAGQRDRSLERDLLDAQAMRTGKVVESVRLLELFSAIEPELFRYPAIDPPAFRERVEAFVRRAHD